MGNGPLANVWDVALEDRCEVCVLHVYAGQDTSGLFSFGRPGSTNRYDGGQLSIDVAFDRLAARLNG